MSDLWMPPVPLGDESDASDALRLLAELHPDWHRHGACSGLVDLFFAERGESTREAKRVCAGCPVLETCREWALTQPGVASGVLGGMSQMERRRIRAARNRARRAA